MPKGLQGFQRGNEEWKKVDIVERSKKISKALTGRKQRHPGSFKKGHSDFVPKEARERSRVKISKALTGKRRTPEQIEKMRGENSSNWKGGKTDESKIWRTRIEYRLWREANAVKYATGETGPDLHYGFSRLPRMPICDR